MKRETYAVYLACRDPRVPWYGRMLAVCVVGYAFSPIDLIPDFVPVLGYIDDLILLPLGIALVLKAIPPEVLAECREKAGGAAADRQPQHWIATTAIVFIWLGLAALGVFLIMRTMRD